MALIGFLPPDPTPPPSFPSSGVENWGRELGKKGRFVNAKMKKKNEKNEMTLVAILLGLPLALELAFLC